MPEKIKILFLCTGNSCRSQMAEGWARHLKADSLEVWSAGTEPKALDPRAVAAMAEVGIDISNQHPKHVREVMGIVFDYVVTVCDHARETCPLFPGPVKRVHVGFEDPPFLARNAATEGEAMAVYRKVRDQIRTFVESLPESLPQIYSRQSQ
ncbi:MAG: arsenate reductase ArsC [Candidatus Oleimicrobiaceae bacterium]